MPRIGSTYKLITPTSSKARQDMVPISKAMRASSSSKPARELPKDKQSKPSYIEMGHSILREKDLQTIKKLGYFNNKVNVWLPDKETILNPNKNEVVVYRSFSKSGFVF
jgi:hypothetical protein